MLLQVRIPRADDQHPPMPLLDLAGDLEMLSDRKQRVLVRLIAVGGRKRRRPQHMRGVVRTTSGDVEQLDPFVA